MNTFKQCNQDRADCAQAAVVAYAGVKEHNQSDMYDFSSEDAQDRLTDLLADLRHFAARSGLNFDRADLMASIHYECELDEEARETAASEGGAA